MISLQRKLKEAEQHLRKTVELKNDFVEAHFDLGGLLGEIGNLREAELFTRKAIKLNPDFEEANYNMELILMNLGKLVSKFHKILSAEEIPAK